MTMLAMTEVLGRWDAWLSAHPPARAMLAKSAPASDLAALEGKLAVALPPSLRALLSWHDGGRKGASMFDGLFRERLALGEHAHLLGHAAIARTGTRMRGERVLVPFAACVNGQRLLMIDSHDGSVWLHGPELAPVAPSLAALFDELLDLLVSGQVEIAPPSYVGSQVVVPDSVRAAASLLAALKEQRYVAVAPNADIAVLVDRLASSFEEPDAISGVLAVIDDDESFAEIFAEEIQLRALVQTFV